MSNKFLWLTNGFVFLVVINCFTANLVLCMMEVIKKLQQLEAEKLNELCRMHLSFTLDLHDDEFSALIEDNNDKKKSKSYFNRFIKEKPISEVMPLNQETISQIYQIIEYLGREINICREGLFRKSGSLVRQNELKTLLRIGESIDFSTGFYTVHDCACVLKSFLAELREPLLSEAHYSAHCQIADMYHVGVSPRQKSFLFQRQLKATKLLLLLLPADNYCLLKYLLLLLNQIHNAQAANKMSSENLATLFSPHIICPKKMTPEELKVNFPRMIKCVTFLIDHAASLFEPPKELLEDVKMYLKDASYEGQLQYVQKELTPVKTCVTFCDRTCDEASDYTKQALSGLQAHIDTMPDSALKRKMKKKLQKENSVEDVEVARQRRHVRSRSVGAAIKRHLLRNTKKKPENMDLRHSAYDMALPMCKSTECIASPQKSKSVDALNLETKDSIFAEMKKNFLRASRKKVQKLVKIEP